MTSQHRILMLGDDPACGGGIASVVESYRAEGLLAEATYVSTYAGAGALVQARTTLKAMRLTIQALCRSSSVLVHVHTASRGSFWRASLYCVLAMTHGRPYLLHIHSGEFSAFYFQECNAVGRWWIRWLLRRAGRVIALTSTWLVAIQTIEPGAKVNVVANPVRVRPALPTNGGNAPRHVVFLGRLRKKKGVFDLVRAIPAVLREVPEARFTLAGDGDHALVVDLARQLGVEHAVSLPGWVDGADRDALLARAGLLVLPSYYEGLPVSVLEAMAAGVVVVAARVGGIPYALDEGRCGGLFEPGDVAALAALIVRALVDGELRLRWRTAAHARARLQFGSATIAAELQALWNEVLGATRT